MIDYRLISDALDFYEGENYQLIEVPWIVEPIILNSTKPVDAVNNFIYSGIDKDLLFEGCFIASAEQGFIQKMIKGELRKNERYVSVSPCYRPRDNEKQYNQECFMKVELFHYGDCFVFDDMMLDAHKFFSSKIEKCDVELKEREYNEFYKDLELRWPWDQENLELGSYGGREIKLFGEKYKISYGTGLADPRFTDAMRELEGYSS